MADGADSIRLDIGHFDLLGNRVQRDTIDERFIRLAITVETTSFENPAVSRLAAVMLEFSSTSYSRATTLAVSSGMPAISLSGCVI